MGFSPTISHMQGGSRLIRQRAMQKPKTQLWRNDKLPLTQTRIIRRIHKLTMQVTHYLSNNISASSPGDAKEDTPNYFRAPH
jgi:hypothetical protein